eukprot:s4551_g7.t1
MIDLDLWSCFSDSLTAPQPGKFEYSNDGYSLAGVMIETLLDVSWEDLMTRELFLPLRMSSAGFGELFLPLRMSSAGFGAPPEIWGTKSGAAGDSAVDPREPGSDNPPAIAPAASGWDVERDVAGGYSLRHDGSNGMNYMRMKLGSELFDGVVWVAMGLFALMCFFSMCFRIAR